MTLAAALVDTHALLELVYVSLIAGIGICGVYALAVLGVTRANERRKANQRASATLYAGLAVLAAAACIWAIVTGITIMATK